MMKVWLLAPLGFIAGLLVGRHSPVLGGLLLAVSLFGPLAVTYFGLIRSSLGKTATAPGPALPVTTVPLQTYDLEEAPALPLQMQGRELEIRVTAPQPSGRYTVIRLSIVSRQSSDALWRPLHLDHLVPGITTEAAELWRHNLEERLRQVTQGYLGSQECTISYDMEAEPHHPTAVRATPTSGLRLRLTIQAHSLHSLAYSDEGALIHALQRAAAGWLYDVAV
jgi:hypothetical protein